MVEQVFADQVFDHNGGLRELNLTTLLQVNIRATWLQPDVLTAEQSRSQNARIGIVRKLIESLIDPERDHRVQALWIELNRSYAANGHSGHRNWRPVFQAPHIFESRRHLVCVRAREIVRARGLRRQEE